MIKTQIQLPDFLYRELKRVAQEREMSLAEVIRRGAEYITRVYPSIAAASSDDKLPGPFAIKLTGDPFTRDDWRYALHERVTTETVAREKRSRYVAKGRKKA